MQCKKCGAELKPDANFCTNCGEPVTAGVPAVAEPSEKEKIKAFKEAEKAKKAEEKAKKAEEKAQKAAKKAEKKARKSRKWIAVLIAITALCIAAACFYFMVLGPFIRSFTQKVSCFYEAEDGYFLYTGRKPKEITDEKEIAQYMADSVTNVPGIGVASMPGEWTPTFYYVKEQGAAIDATGLVRDDYAEGDTEVTEPDREDYKKTGTFFGFEFETYDNAAFNEAQRLYQQKKARDEVRASLTSVQIPDVCDLYYHDEQSGEETLLAENILLKTIAAAGDTEVYTAVVCIPLSVFTEEVATLDELSAESTGELLSGYLSRFLKETAVEATLIVRDASYPVTYRLNESYLVDVPNKNLYHLERKEDYTVRYLERAPLEGNKAGTFKTIDDSFGNGVVYGVTGHVAGSRFYYTKNHDEGTHKSDLCVDGDVVAEDVYHVMQYTDEEGAYEDVLYIKQGVNALKDGSFTLSAVDGKNVKVWCGDAYEVRRLEDGSFAVLKTDGDLVRVTRPGREKKIDDGVKDLYGATGALAEGSLMIQTQPTQIKER